MHACQPELAFINWTPNSAANAGVTIHHHLLHLMLCLWGAQGKRSSRKHLFIALGRPLLQLVPLLPARCQQESEAHAHSKEEEEDCRVRGGGQRLLADSASNRSEPCVRPCPLLNAAVVWCMHWFCTCATAANPVQPPCEWARLQHTGHTLSPGWPMEGAGWHTPGIAIAGPSTFALLLEPTAGEGSCWRSVNMPTNRLQPARRWGNMLRVFSICVPASTEAQVQGTSPQGAAPMWEAAVEDSQISQVRQS